MTSSDISQRFMINDSGVRGQWTLLDASFQTVPNLSFSSA